MGRRSVADTGPVISRQSNIPRQLGCTTSERRHAQAGRNLARLLGGFERVGKVAFAHRYLSHEKKRVCFMALLLMSACKLERSSGRLRRVFDSPGEQIRLAKVDRAKHVPTSAAGSRMGENFLEQLDRLISSAEADQGPSQRRA